MKTVTVRIQCTNAAFEDAGSELLMQANTTGEPVNETKHTPVWATSKDAVPDWHTQVTVYNEASGERVATVFEKEAVHLISAAPELLEALKAYQKVIHEMEGQRLEYKSSVSLGAAYRLGEAAIAKAEGR